MLTTCKFNCSPRWWRFNTAATTTTIKRRDEKSADLPTQFPVARETETKRDSVGAMRIVKCWEVATQFMQCNTVTDRETHTQCGHKELYITCTHTCTLPSPLSHFSVSLSGSYNPRACCWWLTKRLMWTRKEGTKKRLAADNLFMHAYKCTSHVSVCVCALACVCVCLSMFKHVSISTH